ncbi:MAG: hypothetical protein VKO21_06525 [Candidatus Sericytochromatia bacterium]|nr:hypothetical protein [Candidatus Sericytochromatia bacterium]
MRNIGRALGLGCLFLGLHACAWQGTPAGGVGAGERTVQGLGLPGFELGRKAPALHGRVVWPAAVRRIMADEADVALRARISILVPTSGGQYRTDAATRADEGGVFSFSEELLALLPKELDVVMILQAENGLGLNRAGSNSARLRTFLKRQEGGGFVGTYVPVEANRVDIDSNTTAMAVIKSLRDQSPDPAGPESSFVSSLKVGGGAGSLPTIESSKLSDLDLGPTEFPTVAGLVKEALGTERDPLASIELRDALANPRVYALKAGSVPIITDVRYIGGGTPRTVFQPLDPIRVSGVNLRYYNQDIIEFQGSTGVLTGPITNADLAGSTWLDTQVPADIVRGVAQLRYVALGGELAYATMSVVAPLSGNLTPNK